jgi:hypothetical protein
MQPARRIGVLAAALLLACGDRKRSSDETASSEPDPEACSGPPVVVIGSSDHEFVPLDEGDPVVMVHGPQGGWHMLGSIQVFNSTQVVKVHFTITDLDSGVVVVDNSYQVALVLEGECSGYFPGMYGYLNIDELKDGDANTPPELLSYHTMRMYMEIVDRDEREGSAKLDVTAVPDPADIQEDTGSSDSG